MVSVVQCGSDLTVHMRGWRIEIQKGGAVADKKSPSEGERDREKTEISSIKEPFPTCTVSDWQLLCDSSSG